MSEEGRDIFNPFELMVFDNDHCFMCGASLEGDSTVEHVFPKWLQSKYNLWNQTIELLNGSTIPYRQLTIPCCQACNGEHLSQLENDIRRAVDSGYEEFNKLDHIKVFQWVSKLFYGLLFKELTLLRDVRNQELGTIMTPESLERFRLVHLFLQSVRLPFEFIEGVPWSIHVVRIQSSGKVQEDFDYADNHSLLTFSIRMGEVGIIACLQDSGVDHYTHDDYYKKLENHPLHPIQFLEMVAKCNYSNYILEPTPHYMIVSNREGETPVTVICLPVGGMSGIPLYGEWIEAEYAKFLQVYVGKHVQLNYEDVYVDGTSITFLFNENGEFKHIPFISNEAE